MTYSADELRTAFIEGIEEGEEKANEGGGEIKRCVLSTQLKDDRDLAPWLH